MASTVGVIGNVNIDLIIRPVADLPPAGTERIVDRVEMRVGGAAAISALSLASLGAPPLLASCVGDDEPGSWLRRALTEAGVVPQVPAVDGTTSGMSVALEAPEHDRSFLTDLGSLSAFDSKMIGEEVLASRHVLFCGYFLLPALRGSPTALLMERVHAAGSVVLLDTGWDPSGWTPASRAEILAILPSVDILLPNESEVRAVSGIPDARTAARELQTASGGWIVVKRGAAGCVAIGPGGREHEAAAPVVAVVDTVGAGDAFNAGLVHALSSGADMDEAVDLAVRVGSAIVSCPSEDRYAGIRAIIDG